MGGAVHVAAGPKAGQMKGVARQAVWLPVASAGCFLMALVCSESVRFRAFWPELLAVISLGLLLAAVVWQMCGASKVAEAPAAGSRRVPRGGARKDVARRSSRRGKRRATRSGRESLRS